MNNNDNATELLQRCGNCRTPLEGPYCHQCGQPTKGLIRPLSGWVADFFDSVFDYDGRLPRTLVPLLFRPGFLTREYIAGRRVRYVTPVRLFLFLIIVLFFGISLSSDININAVSDNLRPATEDLPRVERVIGWLPEGDRQAVMHDVLSPPPPNDTNTIEISGVDDTGEPIRISWLPDAVNTRLDAAVKHMAGNLRRVNEDPGQFVEQMLSVAPQTLFFMLPLFALILKLFYLFKRRFYMEHLLVALHSHSFIAFTLLIMIGLGWLAGLAGGLPWLATALNWLVIALACWIPINLFLTQKRVYEQGWPMTTLKFVVIGTFYVILLTLGSLVTVLLSLLLW